MKKLTLVLVLVAALMVPFATAYTGDVNISGTVTVDNARVDPNATITWTVPGIYNGSSTNPVQNGWGMYFDGTGDMVNLGVNEFVLPFAGSVEFWVRMNISASSRAYSMSLLGDFVYQHSANDLIYFLGTNRHTDVSPTVNEWQFWEFSWTNSSDLLTVSGSLNTVPFTLSGSATPGSLGNMSSIGASQAANKFLNGSIDEVRVYNRTLGSGEIAYSYENKVPLNQTGLIYWCDLDSNVLDQTAEGHDGTIAGDPEYVRGIRGKADIIFDGDGDYCTGNNIADISEANDFALSGWFSTNELTAEQILLHGGNAANDRYQGRIVGSRLRFGLINATGTEGEIETTNILVEGQNYHFVYNHYANNTVELYLDNVLQSSIPVGVSFSGTNFRIGARGDNINELNGTADEFRYFNRTLSRTEIWEHYNGIYSNITGLVGAWNFDNIFTDYSGEGNTLTPVGDPEFGDGWAYVPVYTSLSGQCSLVNSSTGLMTLTQSAPATPANYTNVNITHPGATQNQTYALFQVDHYLIDLDTAFTETEAGFNALITATGESVLDGHIVDYSDALNVAGVGAMTWTNYTNNFYDQVSSAIPATTTYDTVTSFLEDTYTITSAEINETVTITWTTGTITSLQTNMLTGDWIGAIIAQVTGTMGGLFTYSVLIAILSIGIYNVSGPYATLFTWIMGWSVWSGVTHGGAQLLGIFFLVLGFGLAITKVFIDRRRS